MSKRIPTRLNITTKDGNKETVSLKRVSSTDEYTCTTSKGEELRIKIDEKTNIVTLTSSETGINMMQGKNIPVEAEIKGITPKGKKFGFMLIDPGMFSKDDLIHMKKRQLPLYEIWKCVCHESNYTEVSEAIGAEFCLKLGSDLKEFMDSM